MSSKKRLAIITSHPIQYNAPLFALLNKRGIIDIKVFYTWGQSREGNLYDPGFNKSFQWDIPLLEGYEYEFVHNTSQKPGTKKFSGIKNIDLIPAIKLYNPDAILVYGWSFHSHLHVIRYFSGKVKLLFRGDSTLLDEPSQLSFKIFGRRFFLKWLYRHIDYALFVGKENQKYFEKHGVRADKLKFAPHAVDNDFFAFNEDESNQKALEWRQKLGIKNDEFVILFAGKFEEKKAPALLIRAFLNSSNPKLKLLMTGNGILESEIKSMAANNKNVIFLNFQNQQNMPILYKMADIFILPSKGPGETWGLSVNEAMACGRPVIVSDKVGCCPDLVENGKTGYSFPSNSIESLINLMNNIQSKEVLLNMGINAREKIKSFSYHNVCNVIEDILSNKDLS